MERVNIPSNVNCLVLEGIASSMVAIVTKQVIGWRKKNFAGRGLKSVMSVKKITIVTPEAMVSILYATRVFVSVRKVRRPAKILATVLAIIQVNVIFLRKFFINF